MGRCDRLIKGGCSIRLLVEAKRSVQSDPKKPSKMFKSWRQIQSALCDPKEKLNYEHINWYLGAMEDHRDMTKEEAQNCIDDIKKERDSATVVATCQVYQWGEKTAFFEDFINSNPMSWGLKEISLLRKMEAFYVEKMEILDKVISEIRERKLKVIRRSRKQDGSD